ncbi:hypothetical protein ALC57_17542, partial [Trachymyrmex cornetzi]
ASGDLGSQRDWNALGLVERPLDCLREANDAPTVYLRETSGYDFPLIIGVIDPKTNSRPEAGKLRRFPFEASFASSGLSLSYTEGCAMFADDFVLPRAGQVSTTGDWMQSCCGSSAKQFRPLLSLFCGTSNGYQIFAAPLANNASLDKPESLFTIAGYSFVAFFLGTGLVKRRKRRARPSRREKGRWAVGHNSSEGRLALGVLATANSDLSAVFPNGKSIRGGIRRLPLHWLHSAPKDTATEM